MKTENQSESRLQQFMTYGSSLCGAVVAAALQAFRGGMSFEFSILTFLAAVFGFVAFVVFWKLLFSERKNKRTRIYFAGVTVLLIAGGIAGVLYPLRFVSSHEFPNLVKGLIAATLALSGGAFLLFRCKRFFDADERRTGAADAAFKVRQNNSRC
jgi:hypothetical protein